MVSSYNEGSYWVNGLWERPIYLEVPEFIIIENCFRLIQENQVKCFDYWNKLLMLDEDNLLELIDPENMRIGLEPINDTPCLNCIYTETCSQEDSYDTITDTFYFILGLEANTKYNEFTKANMYLKAIKSILRTAPVREFSLNFPPDLETGAGNEARIANKFLIPRDFKRQISTGIPTSDYILQQTGIQPVLTMEINYLPMELT